MIFIAVADDHQVVRSGITTLLDKMPGFKVIIEAENGLDLINKIHSSKTLPTICIIDINMPIMDGFATVAVLKERWPEIGVLVLSVHNDERYVIRMIQLKANGFLPKNSNAEDLRDAIIAITQEGIYYSDAESRKFMRAVLRNEIRLPKLSALEIVLLKWICTTDLRYDAIAQKMGLTSKSVESHKEALFKKLNVNGRVGLTHFALRFGFIQVDTFSNGDNILNEKGGGG